MNSIRLRSFAVLSAVLFDGSSHALDLTGTWEGKETCTLFAGVASKTKNDITVLITQSGSDLNASFSGGFLTGLYDGVGVAEMADIDRGQAGAYPCGATTTTSMAGSFTAKTDPTTGAGKLKGRQIYVAHTFLESGVTNCKYSLKRTLTANPAVAACP